MTRQLYRCLLGPPGRLFIHGKPEEGLMKRWEQGGLTNEKQTRESISRIHLIYGHIYRWQKASWHTHTHTEGGPMCMCAHVRGLKEKNEVIGLCQPSSSLFSLLSPARSSSSFICRGSAPSPSSHEPLRFCFALQSTHQEKIKNYIYIYIFRQTIHPLWVNNNIHNSKYE